MNEDQEYRISRLEALLDLLSRQEAGKEVLGLIKYSSNGALVLPPQVYNGSEGGELVLMDPSNLNSWSIDNYGAILRVYRNADVALTVDITTHKITLGSSWLLAGGGAWTPLAFAANWTDFAAGNATCAYRQDASGRVWLKGLVKKGVALALPDTIGTLPAGLRPVTQHIVATASFAGYAEIGIATSGAIILRAGGSATWTSLAGISFDPAT